MAMNKVLSVLALVVALSNASTPDPDKKRTKTRMMRREPKSDAQTIIMSKGGAIIKDPNDLFKEEMFGDKDEQGFISNTHTSAALPTPPPAIHVSLLDSNQVVSEPKNMMTAFEIKLNAMVNRASESRARLPVKSSPQHFESCPAAASPAGLPQEATAETSHVAKVLANSDQITVPVQPKLTCEAVSVTCSPGQIESHGGKLFGSSDNSEAACQAKCEATLGCVAFDYTTTSSDNACRGATSGQTPRLGNPGGDNREYCPMIQAYTKVSAGVAGPGLWLHGVLAQGSGVQACFETVMADSRCSKDYFTYATRGNGNCGCKKPGSLTVSGGADAASDYYRVHQAFVPPTQPTLNCKEGVLEKETLAGVTFTCCKDGGLFCAGCAVLTAGKCTECTPGYHLLNDKCSLCADTAGWVDARGLACPDTKCSHTKVKGLSSNDACCKCEGTPATDGVAGGQREATPFVFPEVNLKLDAAVPTGSVPIPRTAERYTINGDCKLGEYGIQIDGETGELKTMGTVCPTVGPCPRIADVVAEPFEVVCELTAHQSQHLKATAKIRVSGSHFSYAQDIIVMMHGRETAAPLVELTQQQLPFPFIQCIPSSFSSWLTMEKSNAATMGQLRATLVDSKMKTMSGISGSPELGIVGALVGARCVVSAQVQAGQEFKTVRSVFTVVAPQMWSSFSYGACTCVASARICPPTQISATINEEAVIQKINVTVQTDQKDMLAPGRFSISCTTFPTSDRLPHGFDALTGVGQVAGHHAFTLDTLMGDLHVAPSAALVAIFDEDGFTGSRRNIVLSCRVFGYYDLHPNWNSPYAYSNSVKITLWDDTCWISAAGKFITQTTVVSLAFGGASAWKVKTPGTTLTGPYINNGTPLPVTVKLDLGDNIWIVGLVNGPYLKMAKIQITGSTTHTWIGTRYDSGHSSACSSQATFTADCFKGTNPNRDSYPVSLQAEQAETDAVDSEGKCRKKCRQSKTCTHFEWKNSVCHLMEGLVPGRCDGTMTDAIPRCTTMSVVTAKVLGCGERAGCIYIKDNNQEWITGDYCHVGLRTGVPVYLKEGATIPDTLFLAKYSWDQDGDATGPRANCAPGMYILKESNPAMDFEDPETEYMELNGKDVKCIGTANEDLLRTILVEGNADAGNQVEGSISAISCGAPNTTTLEDDEDKDEKKVEEQGVSAIVLDDPATFRPADHWMHPCDCFPEAWGQALPVTGDSFNAVPEGSDNKYTPKPVLMVIGAFTCEYSNTGTGRVILGAEESGELSTCEVLCRNANNCNFYWDGEVVGSPQCRSYMHCHKLVRESGSEGSLYALPRSPKKYCHVANPGLCWQVTGRRMFLDANLASFQFRCAWLSLIQQCDHKLLIGGMGIKECGQCTHKEVIDVPEACTEFSCEQKAVSLGLPFQITSSSSDKPTGCASLGDRVQWSQTGVSTICQGCTQLLCDPAPLVPVPKTFAHGRQVGVSCWNERFRVAPMSTGMKLSEILTCVSGSWLDSDGKLGLSNFACAACVQVVKPSYNRLNDQNKQELYFSSTIVTQILIATETSKLGLLETGTFSSDSRRRLPLSADSFLVKSEDGALVVQALAAVAYILGAPNTNTCPSGYAKISSTQECHSAARELALSVGSWNSGETSSSSEPDGCFQDSNSDAYYNSIASGGANSQCTPICKKGAGANGFCLESEANTVANTRELAPLKLKTDACDKSILQQRFASENLPLILQGQVIAQSFPRLLPIAVVSNSIAISGTSSKDNIWAKLKALNVRMDCKQHLLGALGLFVWDIPSAGKTSLSLQCHPTLVSDVNDGTTYPWIQIPMDKHILHFPRAEGTTTTHNNDFMVCPLGEAIGQIEFLGGTALNWRFKCVYVISLGACHPAFTPDVDVEKGSDAGKVEIACDRDQVLQKIQISSMGRTSVAYEFSCCSAAGFPISVVPQNRFHRVSFDIAEGIYCPESRDESGRLQFRKLKSFKEDGHAREACSKYTCEQKATHLHLPFSEVQSSSGKPAGCIKTVTKVEWVRSCSGEAVCGTWLCNSCEVLTCEAVKLFENVLIGSSTANKKCVDQLAPVECEDAAGNTGRRLSLDTWGDKFLITVQGQQVCAMRTDSPGGWGIDLEVRCKKAVSEATYEKPEATLSPQSSNCGVGYTLQDGIVSNYGTCAGTNAPGYCVLPAAAAKAFCDSSSDCDGVSETSNSGWLSAYPGMQSPGKKPINSNAEWKTCVKALPLGLKNGNQVYLKQPAHGTYLGMCGGDTSCSGSKYGVLGYSTKDSRTMWEVEQSGQSVYLKQPGHSAYLGMCGGDTSCGGSTYGVLGYSAKESRTMWEVEQSGQSVYLKQPGHNAYLGMCGSDTSCSGSKHGVFGYSTKGSQTLWNIEQATHALGTPGTKSCPPGYQIIATAAECTAAAQGLSGKWDSWDGWTGVSCAFFQSHGAHDGGKYDTDVYFNARAENTWVTSGTKQYASPICTKEIGGAALQVLEAPPANSSAQEQMREFLLGDEKEEPKDSEHEEVDASGHQLSNRELLQSLLAQDDDEGHDEEEMAAAGSDIVQRTSNDTDPKVDQDDEEELVEAPKKVTNGDPDDWPWDDNVALDQLESMTIAASLNGWSERRRRHRRRRRNRRRRERRRRRNRRRRTRRRRTRRRRSRRRVAPDFNTYEIQSTAGYCLSGGSETAGDLCRSPVPSASQAVTCREIDSNYYDTQSEADARNKCNGDSNCKGYTKKNSNGKAKLQGSMPIGGVHSDAGYQCLVKGSLNRDAWGVNLAGKVSSQSTTAHGGSCGRAIDGNANPYWGGTSCTHTNTEANPWWEVNLGEDSYAITSVKITNRAGETARSDDASIQIDGAWCAHGIRIVDKATKEVTCEGAGQVVRMQLHGSSKILTICEFGVAGTKVTCAPGYYTRRRTVGPGLHTSCDFCNGDTRRRRAQDCTPCPVGQVSVGWQDACVEQVLGFDRTKSKWVISNSAHQNGEDLAINSDAAHPLEADYLPGQGFAVEELSDFSGVFEGNMPNIKQKSPKRKKPKLLTLKTVHPSYAEECKDEVLPGSGSFNMEKMNEVGLGLPAGSPCNMVAGKWEDTALTHEPTGAAYTEGDTGTDAAGIDYAAAANCGTRTFARDKAEDVQSFTKFLVDQSAELGLHITNTLCTVAPSAEIAPVGFGVAINMGDICHGIVSHAAFGLRFVKDLGFESASFARSLTNSKDCDQMTSSFNRVFCDLHCIRDAVKAGDKAILSTLTKSVGIMGRNMDMLLEYHTGTAKDELLHAIQAGQHAPTQLAQAHTVKADLLGMFTEMRSMLGGNLDRGGHATATRALNMFSARFSEPDVRSNHTKLMHELVSEATTLLSTVQAAASRQLSTGGEASRRTASALHKFNQVIRDRNYMLGMYRSSAKTQKETQRSMSPSVNPMTALKDDIQRTSATALLLEFDRSWWTIREKLDAYLESAETQNIAFTDAITAINDYTSKCSADFTDLNHAHMKVQRADQAASTQLQDTWHAVEHELGLLTARIADSHGFLQLAHLDAASADFETNRTAICSQGKTSKEAALLAVDLSLSQGLFKQTWKQLVDAFDEAEMLRGRFFAMRLRTPSNKTLMQAVDRAGGAFMEAVDRRSDITLAAAQRACGQESTLVQMPAADESKRIGDLEAALKTIRDVESEKDRAMKKNLDLEIEKFQMEVKNHQMEEKLHALEVHELEEKVRNMEAKK